MNNLNYKQKATILINKINNYNENFDIYKVTNILVEAAEIVGEARKEYDSTKYPNINGRIQNHFDIYFFDKTINNLVVEIEEFLDKINLFNIKSIKNSEETKDILEGLLLEIKFSNYEYLSDIALRKIKKELICKNLSILNKIEENKKTNYDYKYDNTIEFNNIKELFTIYENASESNKHLLNKLKNIFNIIETNYKYINM